MAGRSPRDRGGEDGPPWAHRIPGVRGRGPVRRIVRQREASGSKDPVLNHGGSRPIRPGTIHVLHPIPGDLSSDDLRLMMLLDAPVDALMVMDDSARVGVWISPSTEQMLGDAG